MAKKTVIRYRTRKVRTRRHSPKIHSILGTFFGGMALAEPFLFPKPNGDTVVGIWLRQDYDIQKKIRDSGYWIRWELENHWPKLLGYAIAGGLISWFGKKYLGNTTQISKHWRII
jgi:hypothetical protein